ncbi:MAG: DUF885 family protein, partial [Steroidobacteraceae bacterium]
MYAEAGRVSRRRVDFRSESLESPHEPSFLGDSPDDRRRCVTAVGAGLHSEGWTRQQAIDFFKANAPKSELDIANEIDRYIAWPGQ